MAKKRYNLNECEKIVFKITNVKHGFWDSYTSVLIITNQGIILEKYGIFDNFRGIERYDYSDINQAIHTKSQNGSKQLEIYIGNKIEEFELQSGDDNELKILTKSINDQMGPNSELYDFQYYQELLNSIKEEERLLKLRAIAEEEDNVRENLGLAGEVVKNIIKSGDISIRGVTRGITKATMKQKRGSFDKILDDMGVRDIQDEFTEIGNEFRESIGLKPKMTHANRKELEELEEKRRKKNLVHEKALSTNEKINEQLELLRKTKELLDAGILTEEEFEIKKREIMQF